VRPGPGGGRRARGADHACLPDRLAGPGRVRRRSGAVAGPGSRERRAHGDRVPPGPVAEPDCAERAEPPAPGAALDRVPGGAPPVIAAAPQAGTGPTRSATVPAAFRPDPLSITTVVSSARIVPAARSRAWAAAAVALVGSTNSPRPQSRASAATMSSSGTATVPPPLSRTAATICANRSGRAIAV